MSKESSKKYSAEHKYVVKNLKRFLIDFTTLCKISKFGARISIFPLGNL